MGKYIIVILIFFSCKTENKYETALNTYLKDDLHFKQSRIDYQIETLKRRAYRQQKRYGAFYNNVKKMNEFCLDFEKKVLNIESIDIINTEYKTLKYSIRKIDFF